MPLLLRKVRSSRWYSREKCPWLEAGELQADPLGDLQTMGNALSVWRIENDESNLRNIILALVRSCDHPQNIDYILFNQCVLDVCTFNCDISLVAGKDLVSSGKEDSDISQLNGIQDVKIDMNKQTVTIKMLVSNEVCRDVPVTILANIETMEVDKENGNR